VPRGALLSYCGLLQPHAHDLRDGYEVPISGDQLLALAAWLDREPDTLSYENVEDACAAAKALDAPLMLRSVDVWLGAQEAWESTHVGGGVLGQFNYKPANLASKYSKGTPVTPANAGERFQWAVQLATKYRLPRFAAAFYESLTRYSLPDRNARELLLHVARHALLSNAE